MAIKGAKIHIGVFWIDASLTCNLYIIESKKTHSDYTACHNHEVMNVLGILEFHDTLVLAIYSVVVKVLNGLSHTPQSDRAKKSLAALVEKCAAQGLPQEGIWNHFFSSVLNLQWRTVIKTVWHFLTLLLVNQWGALQQGLKSYKPLHTKKELAKREDVLKPTNMCCIVIRLWTSLMLMLTVVLILRYELIEIILILIVLCVFWMS